MVPFWKITEDMHHSYEWLQSKNEVDEDTCELHQELIDEFSSLVDAGVNDMCSADINPLIQKLGDFDGEFESIHQEF